MRLAVLILAAILILAGDLLILAVARTLPATVFAGNAAWAWLAGLLIVSGILLVVWINLRQAA